MILQKYNQKLHSFYIFAKQTITKHICTNKKEKEIKLNKKNKKHQNIHTMLNEFRNCQEKKRQ